MANVLQPNLDFHPRPVSHPTSALGFGFGLSSGPSSSMSAAPAWGSTQQPGHTNPAAFHQLASSIAQSVSSSKSQKRRLDPDDDAENIKYPARDHSMDRSPTPERPKRAAYKRTKVVNIPNSSSKEDSKDKKSAEAEDDSIDLGVLLASLPSQSLLPIITGLLKKQPTLKSHILTLIPRPSLEDAVGALKLAAKKLQDAIPYTNPPSVHFSFGASQQPVMRDEYVLGRLRPHVTDFASACLSYFPYFSYRYPFPDQSKANNPSQRSVTSSNSLQKEKFYPAETFAFLSNITKLIIDQPSLVLAEIEPLLIPRLTEEWKLWLDNLDRHANREGNMVAPSLSQSWENDIERLMEGKAPGISQLMRDVRQHFPLKHGWGFPQRTPSMMLEA
ncbi:hypothetical protein CPB83DRAFT_872317 [Crepidotus variabilis]|uniref:Tethering factor for nuclear proteasome STS1 n=1 Tax=Crepidotus variabilis TaxID=179855 RepID=A0A9P6JWS2_9AGAR|nr:hypothetical protein CPB83DRAFT_872317 [Crepidotus variabilis]